MLALKQSLPKQQLVARRNADSVLNLFVYSIYIRASVCSVPHSVVVCRRELSTLLLSLSLTQSPLHFLCIDLAHKDTTTTTTEISKRKYNLMSCVILFSFFSSYSYHFFICIIRYIHTQYARGYLYSHWPSRLPNW